MRRELIIIRHAKSAWDTPAPTDFDRPLAKRGKKAAPRVGRWLRQQGLFPDWVISSPAERARQTVLLVCEQLGFDPELIEWDNRIYGGDPATLTEILRECPNAASRVIIAGHNPGLEMLVEALSRTPLPWQDDGKLMPTAAVAHFAIDAEWARIDKGCADLLSITRARSLSGR